MNRTQSLKLTTLIRQSHYESCGYPRLLERKDGFNPVYPAAGRQGSVFNLFKVLLSNHCRKNCLYCVNRSGRNCIRFRLSPSELAGVFMEYYRRGWVKGLFLSSAIDSSAEHTQEKMIAVLRLLRLKYAYRGYVHCKILPGVGLKLISEAADYSDRLSINLETPGEQHLKNIAPSKNYREQLFGGLRNLAQTQKVTPLKNGITTQIMVGADNESDREILNLSNDLYRRFGLKRVYYSGFMPVKDTPLEHRPPCSPWREFRLYQADSLLRDYGFKSEELIFDARGNLRTDIDPKLAWALAHPEFFPQELNRAMLAELIKIPGIGKISAMKIIGIRRHSKINHLSQLSKLRINPARVRNFVLLDGRFFGDTTKEALPAVNNFVAEGV
jgi:predicted DNA-binding helix-hairpin-helix protein